MHKKDVKDFTLEELKKEMLTISELPYRAKQIFFWLYQRGASGFNQMENLPRTLRNKLEEKYYISTLSLSQHLKSTDGTEKFLFKLFDGNFMETVLIPAKRRKTICLSSQIGCKFTCPFCASGQRGLIRNLTPAEITNQILYLDFNLNHRLTNYVFMGMGEPLDNFINVAKAIMIMNDAAGLNIGARRMTISTCGIIPGIDKLKDLQLQVNLSISLHAANNALRNSLMPVNRCFPLEKLFKSCEHFMAQTKRLITLEYVLIKDKNDSLKDIGELASVAKRLRAKVNLIPYSPVAHLKFCTPAKREINIFIQKLKQKGVKVTLRESKGKDIQAACGQLLGKPQEKGDRLLFYA